MNYIKHNGKTTCIKTLVPSISLKLFLVLVISVVSLSSVYAQSYVRSTTNSGIETIWLNHCIPVYLHQVGSQKMDITSVQEDLIRSITVWNDPECSHLKFSFQGLSSNGTIGYQIEAQDQNENLIRFRSDMSEWYYDPLALALTTLTICQTNTEICQTGEIIDADIEINEAYFPVTHSQASPIQIDLMNTLVHEFGHFIGFDHNSDTQSTMFPAAPLGETIKRDLNDLDIDGLCSVYTTEAFMECMVSTDESTGSLDDLDQGCQSSTKHTHVYLILFILVCMTAKRNQWFVIK